MSKTKVHVLVPFTDKAACGVIGPYKFQIPELRQKLLDTGNAYLIEGNWWGDRYWGVCRGAGQNKLGKLLMQVRGEIKNAK